MNLIIIMLYMLLNIQISTQFFLFQLVRYRETEHEVENEGRFYAASVNVQIHRISFVARCGHFDMYSSVLHRTYVDFDDHIHIHLTSIFLSSHKSFAVPRFYYLIQFEKVLQYSNVNSINSPTNKYQCCCITFRQKWIPVNESMLLLTASLAVTNHQWDGQHRHRMR